jgi:hypothetical protein
VVVRKIVRRAAVHAEFLGLSTGIFHFLHPGLEFRTKFDFNESDQPIFVRAITDIVRVVVGKPGDKRFAVPENLNFLSIDVTCLAKHLSRKIASPKGLAWDWMRDLEFRSRPLVVPMETQRSIVVGGVGKVTRRVLLVAKDGYVKPHVNERFNKGLEVLVSRDQGRSRHVPTGGVIHHLDSKEDIDLLLALVFPCAGHGAQADVRCADSLDAVKSLLLSFHAFLEIHFGFLGSANIVHAIVKKAFACTKVSLHGLEINLARRTAPFLHRLGVIPLEVAAVDEEIQLVAHDLRCLDDFGDPVCGITV